MSDTRLEVLADGFAFTECPRWRDDRLWFSDMHEHGVYTLDLDGGVERQFEVDSQPAGLGWRPDGTLLVVGMKSRTLNAWDGRSLTQVADLSDLAPWHCNDMVVADDGTAYIGNFGWDLDYQTTTPRRTNLVMVDGTGTPSVVAEDLSFPNGMVIIPQGPALVVGETMDGALTAFDIGEGGLLSNRRTWAKPEGLIPDGICLDSEGGIWVANPLLNEVVRVTEGGEVTDRISTGESGAIACMLGGPDGRTLFVCTASTTHPDQSVEMKSGKIQAIEVAVPHAGLP
ncbi:MAG: 6-deoxy-6-sulfogluconolactonase [Acidimicrobiales bacterium]|nr:MAG: hypothetical protein EDR02_07780 [Actinomycetota bacterium]MBV6509915.1 6-deoxy-6-sulfogluconolactonase [Acidimicrobiales bacterium]RIK08592.1 MAG: hypothetical protein DCC48_01225 [Acidobacteriota bacterium]